MENLGKNPWLGIVRHHDSVSEMLRTWDEGHYLTGSPATRILEQYLSGYYGGADTLVVDKGRNAVLATVLALTSTGDLVAVSTEIYPGTKNLFKELEARGILKVLWFDPLTTDIFAMMHSLTAEVKMCFVETIGNSKTMPVIDPDTYTADCRNYLVIDSTFTPLWVPEEYQWENLVLIGSLTKYEQPEDEAAGGRISASIATIEKIAKFPLFANFAMLPSTAEYYLEHVAETKARYEAHSLAADELARACLKHPAIKSVYYPTLTDDGVLEKWYGGLGGGVLYIVPKGGEEAAKKIADGVVNKVDWTIAVSFGSNEWRICPFVGPLAKYVDEPGLTRISVGRQRNKANTDTLMIALDSLD
ncbi:MAG: PLP-dependent transferase [Patescibacteria group bacterium]|nr:PLP-dependent transferase [Patescibacteria group bacterium]